MKEITHGELLNRGYIQEVNRLFFHPLGLYMKVEGGKIVVYDFRDRSEGIQYREIDTDFTEFIEMEYHRRGFHRLHKYGEVVQTKNE